MFTIGQHSYQEYGHHIFYCITYSSANPSPKKVTINDQTYTRFLDFIYMPCETHELTREQCIAVNDIRNIYYETHKNMSINKTVKRRISTVVDGMCINNKRTLLEFGCGFETIYPLLNSDIIYIGADISLSAINSNKEKSPKGSYIVVDEEQMPIKDKSIDLLVSIFVFHFKISHQQLSELFRILSDDGAMIFNLYLLPKQQRETLFFHLAKIGFTYHRESDPDQLCRDHEYCFLATNPNSLLYKKAIQLFKFTVIKDGKQGCISVSQTTDTKELNGIKKAYAQYGLLTSANKQDGYSNERNNEASTSIILSRL